LEKFLKIVENEQLANGDLDYIRHQSPEGGFDTIGYGHKISLRESRSGKVHGLIIEHLDIYGAEAILQTDIKVHENLVRLNAGTYGYTFDELDDRRKEMLIEINFNVGDVVRKFPTFTKAVFMGDEETMKKEHHRSYTDVDGVRHRLGRRNEMFEATYFE
jgi:hypothetical protein